MRGFLLATTLFAFGACGNPALAQDYGRPDYRQGYDYRYDQTNWRDGVFFREPGNPTTFYQYRSRRLCGVQNEQQLQLFGDYRQVLDVGRVSAVGRLTGACPWPNGFYRRRSEETVFWLSGNTSNNTNGWGNRICGVTSQEQMRRIGWGASVTIVPDNTDLQAGRGRWQPCRG